MVGELGAVTRKPSATTELPRLRANVADGSFAYSFLEMPDSITFRSRQLFHFQTL